MKLKKKKLLVICICAGVIAAAAVLLVIFVFPGKDPYKLLHSTDSADIEKISMSRTARDDKRIDITGKDIDEFLALLRDADYKSAAKDEAYAEADRGYPIAVTVHYKDGTQQQLTVLGGYGSGGVTYRGFVVIEEKCFECSSQPFFDFYNKRQK